MRDKLNVQLARLVITVHLLAALAPLRTVRCRAMTGASASADKPAAHFARPVMLVHPPPQAFQYRARWESTLWLDSQAVIFVQLAISVHHGPASRLFVRQELSVAWDRHLALLPCPVIEFLTRAV